jgi:hypothetical protein
VSVRVAEEAQVSDEELLQSSHLEEVAEPMGCWVDWVAPHPQMDDWLHLEMGDWEWFVEVE